MKLIASAIICVGLLLLGLSVADRKHSEEQRENRQKCIENAQTRGRAELNCKAVEVKEIGTLVLVAGCGKSVTYECSQTTPKPEGK